MVTETVYTSIWETTLLAANAESTWEATYTIHEVRTGNPDDYVRPVLPSCFVETTVHCDLCQDQDILITAPVAQPTGVEVEGNGVIAENLCEGEDCVEAPQESAAGVPAAPEPTHDVPAPEAEPAPEGEEPAPPAEEEVPAPEAEPTGEEEEVDEVAGVLSTPGEQEGEAVVPVPTAAWVPESQATDIETVPTPSGPEEDEDEGEVDFGVEEDEDMPVQAAAPSFSKRSMGLVALNALLLGSWMLA